MPTQTQDRLRINIKFFKGRAFYNARPILLVKNCKISVIYCYISILTLELNGNIIKLLIGNGADSPVHSFVAMHFWVFEVFV